jgi:hypothetical protein
MQVPMVQVKISTQQAKAKTKEKKAPQRLTQQHLANRLDDTNQKRFAFLKMCDPRY